MLSVLQEPLSDHTQSLDYVLDYLKQQYSSTIKDEVAALGHRVVHGKHLSEPMLVDEKVMQVCSFLLMFLANTLELLIHIRFKKAIPLASSLTLHVRAMCQGAYSKLVSICACRSSRRLLIWRPCTTLQICRASSQPALSSPAALRWLHHLYQHMQHHVRMLHSEDALPAACFTESACQSLHGGSLS